MNVTVAQASQAMNGPPPLYAPPLFAPREAGLETLTY